MMKYALGLSWFSGTWQIINISSTMGSLTTMSSLIDSGPMTIGGMGYKASKAALNMGQPPI